MLVESQQQSAALPLLNHNNRKCDSNASKWDEDDFANLLGCVDFSIQSLIIYAMQLALI